MSAHVGDGAAKSQVAKCRSTPNERPQLFQLFRYDPGVGAVLTVHFLDNGLQPIRATDIENHTISGLKKLFWYWCLSRGFWITERGMLSIILGTTREEIDSYVQTVQDFIKQHIDLVKI